jgi:hypothetical protein
LHCDYRNFIYFCRSKNIYTFLNFYSNNTMTSQLFSNFDAETTVFMAHLNAIGNATRLQVSGGKMTSLNGQLAEWSPLYLAYKDPLTKSESQHDIEVLYAAFNKDVEDLKAQLKANTDITLTGTDILRLFIHVDLAPRHFVSVPNITPTNSCSKYAVGVNKIYTGNPTEGHTTDRHLPDDVAKIGRAIAFVNHYQPVPARSAFVNMSSIGTTSYDIIIPTENRHQVAYIITWYISNRGENGGESDPTPFDTV